MNHVGIYIHIPFCRKKCDYCGFFSTPIGADTDNASIPDKFITRLASEFGERLIRRDLSADTVYMGGGTPSLLSIDQVRALLRALEARVEIAPDAEITLEMNPEDVSREKLEGYRDAGVNRIVLGVQTLCPRLSRIIGRSAGVCTESALDTFFSTPGFNHSMDLIIGIPSQRKEELDLDFDSIAHYRPLHVSAYLLSIEKHTPLAGRLTPDCSEEDRQARLYGAAVLRLASSGYYQYEISNFALPGHFSRHNLKYWKFDPYIGFGPGSHTFMDGHRAHNAMSVAEYVSSDHTRLSPDIRKPESALVEYIMTGLRLLAGISIRDMERCLGRPVPGVIIERIMKARKEGTLVVTENEGDVRLRLSKRGIILADSVIYKIVDALL